MGWESIDGADDESDFSVATRRFLGFITKGQPAAPSTILLRTLLYAAGVILATGFRLVEFVNTKAIRSTQLGRTQVTTDHTVLLS